MKKVKTLLKAVGSGLKSVIKKVFRPKVLAVLMILAVGAAGGFLASNAMNKNDNKELAPAPKASAALNADMVLLGVHQFNLLTDTAEANVDNTRDKDALKTSLDEATDQLAAAVGSPYGPEQKEAAKKAYLVYKDQILAYAIAVKSNNQAAKQDAINKLTSDYVDALTPVLSKANPKIENAYVQAGFGTSATSAMRVIDQYIASNPSQELQESQAGVNSIKAFYSYLAGKTAEQFPEQYNKQ